MPLCINNWCKIFILDKEETASSNLLPTPTTRPQQASALVLRPPADPREQRRWLGSCSHHPQGKNREEGAIYYHQEWQRKPKADSSPRAVCKHGPCCG